MRRRALVGLPFAIVCAAAAALYAPTIAGLLQQWYQDTSTSHGVLLVAAAAFVIYRRRAVLRALPAEPGIAGFALLAAAMVVYLLGSVTGDVFILRASMPVAMAGCVMALYGAPHMRVLLAPLLLLAIAIPLPSVVVTYLTLPLQLVASRVAEGILATSGVAVTRSGNILALPNITLEVAEACSGLRSAVSLASVAAIGCAVMSLSVGRSALLVSVAIPIAVVGNGLRVAGTGFLALWMGDAAVKGLVHELTGFVAFAVMGAAVLAVQLLTRSRGRRRPMGEPCPAPV